ncbi:sulfide/dihydroorotate dehydrogenase-like FAD/NAD-binding protein [candidate division TA06 bacterium]|uniref:Sulfide/dihydroorotate dehydrogenase-like FAD/NAD-binding protein n=1 Tax=candidate division TA06 bacterium TaxID=2250710 RepID=A0A933ML09_UNCT6|nr:sulfide/dihydroorotate dehydrogenase-like FAD/NAD-binding protein [candidate division TA06 bacterium]
MYPIIDRQELAKGNMVLITVEAPQIARKIKPGQFVVLRINETGERVPLTVAYKDLSHGTITIIFMVIGKSTALLGSLKVGDAIKDLVGPLGVTEEFAKLGTIVGIGGGSGIAVLHHLLQGYEAAGNKLIGIIGARERDLLILEDEMKTLCRQLIVTTDDGSYGMHGLVTDALKTLVERDNPEPIDLVIAVGPLVMMRSVCQMTKLYNLKTLVSLNPVMVDATGMCGSCRVTIGGQTKFACVDGPHFDGHLVDFDELIQRNNSYTRDEKTSLLFSIRAK